MGNAAQQLDDVDHHLVPFTSPLLFQMETDLLNLNTNTYLVHVSEKKLTQVELSERQKLYSTIEVA